MATLKKHKPTLKDIAEAANVSVPTASMALADHPEISQKTKRSVRSVSEKFGYRRPSERPATQQRKAASVRPRRIGYMLIGGRFDDESTSIDLQAVTVHAQASEVRLEIAAIESTDPSQAADKLEEFAKHIDALMVSGYVDQVLLRRIDTLHIPYIVLGHVMEDARTLTSPHQNTIVCCDELEMGFQGTTHLMAYGHERIAFVCEVAPPGLSHSQWLAGYQLAYLKAQRPVDPQLTYISGQPHTGAKAAVDAFMALDAPPTAFVVPDVRIGASLINALAERDQRPDPMSVILAGRQSIAKRYHVEDCLLIEYNFDQMAKVAIEYLLRMHKQEILEAVELVLPSRLHNFPKSPKT